jgi:type I restriction enzyme S subunit
MGKWPEVALESLAAPHEGAIAIGPFGSSMKADTYAPVGVPVIRGTNISNGRAWKGDWVFIPPEFADRMPRCIATSGTLVFPHRGAIGEIAIVPKDHYARYFLSTSLMKIEVDEKKANPNFVYFFFRSPAGRSEILKYASQVGTPGIGQPLSSLRQFKVPLPPMVVQDAIASLLGALEDKIELNRRMNHTLEAMARAVFKDWFVDFGPTRAKMEGRASYLAPEIWALFPDQLEDEGRPNGWQLTPLTTFFLIIGGGTPKTSVVDYWNGTIPWFSVVDTPSSSNVFVVETEKTITQAGLDASSARLVPEGTTIISARGTVGNLAMAGQQMTFNQSCYGLRGQNGAGDCFVFLVAQNAVGRLQSMAHGSVFSTITRQTFETQTLARPPMTVLKAFEEAAQPLLAKIKASVGEARTLSQIRDLLLPRLMSGEIRIKDAEKVTEAVL